MQAVISVVASGSKMLATTLILSAVLKMAAGTVCIQCDSRDFASYGCGMGSGYKNVYNQARHKKSNCQCCAREAGRGYVSRWCISNDHNSDRFCQTTRLNIEGVEYWPFRPSVTICRFDYCNAGSRIHDRVADATVAALVSVITVLRLGL